MATGLIVRFYLEAVHMKYKSEKEGRPIFEDREFVSIIPIGDNKTQIVREATDDDRSRFPEEYARFKKGDQDAVSGTPLKEWPYMRPSQIRMLNYLNVFTVEHLAELSDDAISRIGTGGRKLIEQAKAYLAKAKDTGATQHYAAENERLNNELAEMRRQLAELASRIPIESEVKRRPGRPPKAKAA